MTGEDTTQSARPTSRVEDWLLACFQKALGHELPNQLVAAQGLLRLLEMEEGERLTTDGRDYLRRLSAGAERSHTLIHALAEIVRAARSTEAPQPVVPADVLREAAAEVKQAVPGRTVEFRFDILVPSLSVPPRSFRQAVVHLFRYLLLAGDGADLRIEVAARPAPGGMELRVADNGRGLSPAQQARLFEPFTDGEGGAVGRLGLVLVQTLVHNWGGTIRVQSEPGQGSTFVLLLPAPEDGGRR